MKQFEYKITEGLCDIDRLNAYGSDGWELVATYVEQHGISSTQFYYWKRNKRFTR